MALRFEWDKNKAAKNIASALTKPVPFSMTRWRSSLLPTSEAGAAMSNDELLPAYDFDYSKARPNRFAGRIDNKDRLVVVLDPDIAQVFSTPEDVKAVLRALIATMP